MSGSGSGTGTPVGSSGSSPVNPLFLTRAELLARIKLTTATDDDSIAQIDRAIHTVRLEIFKAITAERALIIAAYASADNPTTDEEILKLNGSIAESLWIQCLLLDVMPSFFIDNSARTTEAFNEEPLTRDASAIKEMKDALLKQVFRCLNRLKATPTDGDDSTEVALIGRVDDETGEDDPYIVRENFIGLDWGDL